MNVNNQERTERNSRKFLRENVSPYKLSYYGGHPGCDEQKLINRLKVNNYSQKNKVVEGFRQRQRNNVLAWLPPRARKKKGFTHFRDESNFSVQY